MIRESKKDHFKKLVMNSKDARPIWKAINELTNKKKNNHNETPINFSADVMNDYFLSTAQNHIEAAYNINVSDYQKSYVHNSGLITHCENKLKDETPFIIPTLTVHDVGKLVSNLKNKKSTGPDSLSSYILKICLPYIVEPLTYAYNLCISRNEFPHLLKEAKVIPLPKKTDTTNISGFRPISILPSLSKPIEKHVHSNLLTYMESHNLFISSQSGFRPNHSCQTAILKICDSWLAALNKGEIVGATFLDFSKAFDTINHHILLEKLKLYLGNSKSLLFFQSFLNNRSQSVYLNGRYSEKKTIYTGVPQGSILGPLLFCIYINDLPLYASPNNSSVSTDLFADDSSNYTSGKHLYSIQHDLQKHLDLTSTWCKDNLMILNASKSKCMIVATRQRQQLYELKLHLHISDKTIEQVQFHKVLGITLDSEFKWLPHLENVLRLVSRNLFLLSQLKHYADEQSLKLFFYGHILSHVSYASSAWDGCAEDHKLKLNSLLRRAAKLISSEKNLDTINKMKRLGFLTLEQQLKFNKGVLVFKIIKGKAPNYLQNLLITSNRHGSFNLIKPLCHIDLYQTSLMFSGPDIWNNIPLSIRSSISLTVFKKSFRKFLLQQ